MLAMQSTIREAKKRAGRLLRKLDEEPNPRLNARDLRDLRMLENVARDVGELDLAGELMSTRLQLRYQFVKEAA